MKHELIVIGGGASGIMAAITAKDMGIDTAILEGSDRIAKKILITGNGRCNITNKNIEALRYHSDNPDFFKPALNNFGNEDTINFFNTLGLPLTTLEEGKMYPMSLQASSVIDILRLALEDRNIPIYLNSKVIEIHPSKKEFEIITNDETLYQCKRLLLATGGKSVPKTGSDGSGYSLAKALGHKIIEPIPALVQLKLDYSHLKALSGIKFNGFAEVLVDGKSERREFGEILFTDYGISGPPILQLSRTASKAISKNKKVTLKIDMFPQMEAPELEDFLEIHWAIFSHRSINDSLIGIINKKMIAVILKESGILNIHKACSDLKWDEKKNLYNLLKSWQFNVTDTNSFNNSQVTTGGIDTTEVFEDTMESKLIPNLYFSGEILDVDGDCGGFNLQWAWSSGYAAAKGICSK